MTTYPCISLHQPWASALFLRHGPVRLKVHETRSWPAPQRLIGRRVAIHAAKKRHPLLDEPDFIDELMNYALRVGDWRGAVPYGAVLGTVLLAGSSRMYPPAPISGGRPTGNFDEAFGDWSPERFAWRMDDPQPLAEPIPWKGQQGWFTVDLP